AFSLPAACLYCAVAYAYISHKLPLCKKNSYAGIFYILAGALLLTILFKPLRAGGAASFPALEYAYYRLRYFFAKPQDPLSLPGALRFVWTVDNASPSHYSLFSAFFPLVWFVPAVLMAARSLKGKKAARPADSAGDLPAEQRDALPVMPVLLTALICTVLYMVSRSTMVLAMPVIITFLALSLRNIRQHVVSRGLFLSAGIVLILAQTFTPGGKLDFTRQAAMRLNLTQNSSGEFFRVSVGDADQSLVRFLIRRTSVKDPILAAPSISSVLTTFAGRTTLLAPGIESEAMIEKTIFFVGKYYDSEKEFYEACRESGVEYVLYSIEFVLDRSNYSPLYLAGTTQLPPASVAYKMHFFPEMLTHFTLTYENDNYRLFKVTDEIRPIFSTDHPLVYQYDILDLHNESLELFYKRVLNLVYLYGTALDEQARGNYEAALDILNGCLRQAPRYTAARLAQAGSFVGLGDGKAAMEAYETVISYAPDNPQALYGLAFSLARTGETARAKEFVDILLFSTGDDRMIEKAKLLKWFLEQGIPVDSPDSLQANTPR
ncbi:MAG: tetratricopeptide repeat protein, partial [Candidatus Latescibacterota bacterium]